VNVVFVCKLNILSCVLASTSVPFKHIFFKPFQSNVYIIPSIGNDVFVKTIIFVSLKHAENY